jgi:hypothetical protein
MKAITFLLVCLVYFFKSNAQSEDALFYESTLRPEQKVYYELIKKKDFVALLFTAKASYTQSETGDDCLGALITACLELGKKDSAMRYIDEYIKISCESMDMFGGISLRLLCDYRFCEKLCFDTAIERYVLAGIERHYRSQKHPETEYGVKLISMGFRDQKIRGLRSYRSDTCRSDASKAWVQAQFEQADTANLNDLLALLKKAKGYLSNRKVGEVSACQNMLFTHAYGSKRTRDVIPVIKAAYEKGEYGKVRYIFQLVRTEELAGKVKRADGSYKKLQDELCRQYNCAPFDQYFMDF